MAWFKMKNLSGPFDLLMFHLDGELRGLTLLVPSPRTHTSKVEQATLWSVVKVCVSQIDSPNETGAKSRSTPQLLHRDGLVDTEKLASPLLSSPLSPSESSHPFPPCSLTPGGAVRTCWPCGSLRWKLFLFYVTGSMLSSPDGASSSLFSKCWGTLGLRS